ncbi:MAG: YHYH protein [Bacteroidota bacterium]
MKKISFAILFFSIIAMSSFAHPGGHYKKEDLSILHHWETRINNESIVGNYLMSKNDFILIEGIEGKIWRLSTGSITSNDKKYLNTEISNINLKNGINLPLISDGVILTPWDFQYFFQLALLALIAIGFYFLSVFAYKNNYRKQWQFAFSTMTICFIILFFVSCKKNTPVTPSPGPTDNGIPKSSTSFIDSAFTPYKPSISTSWDSTYFYVSGGGFPNHNMMIGITSWQQQVPLPQAYTGSNHWSIPLQPVYATTPLSTRYNFMKGAVAIGVDGIPIFNALNNRGEDSYAIGELDNWGGHCGKADDYHYHSAPLHLSATSGLMPIAFALDGFAVYGAKEPDGTNMQSLDTCHGHIYNSGVYHYHGTTTYPYVVGAMKGKVTIDPTTPAPENQILPQAFATPIRPPLTPLRGAVISDFTNPTSTSHHLTYQINSRNGHVNYSWDNAGNYHFEFIDTAGTTTTADYHH